MTERVVLVDEQDREIGTEEMAREPDSFTPWLRILWSDVRNLQVLNG